MNILQNRIDSYQTSLVKWPHTGKHYNKTETFAKAGFYFVRRPKNADSVRCFMCDIELSHWRPAQSPFARHSIESPTCAWKWLGYPDANKKPLPVNKKDSATDPRSSTMRTARLATFGNHNFWPPNKSMLNKKKYPTGSKLADAGFFFSPTPTQASRIKCPYCKITIDEPAINENLLQNHQELSSGCEFFALTSNMRATRSRRDTIDSTHSNDTFITARSSLQNDDTYVDTKKHTVKRKASIEAKSTFNENSKQQSSQDNKLKPKRQRTVSKKESEDPLHVPEDSLLDLEPIKIIKRKKPTELPATASSTPIKHETIELTRRTEKETSNADSVWDIENAFSLPSISRRSTVTYGKSSARRTLTSAKLLESKVNIFANLKPSLIIKSGEQENDNVPVSTGDLISNNNTSIEKATSLIQPEKSIKKVADETQSQVRLTKKRSLSSSTSSTSAPTKHLRLKVVVDTKPEPPQQVVQDIYVGLEFEKKRDKGKGRAIEYSHSPPASQKKKLSLSKSKNKQISSNLLTLDSLEHDVASSSSSNHSQRSSIGSSAPAQVGEDKIKKYQMPEGFIVNTPPKSPSPVNQNTAQIPVTQKSALPDLQKSGSPLHDEANYIPMLAELPQSPMCKKLACKELHSSPEFDHLDELPEITDLVYSPQRQRSFSPLPLQEDSEISMIVPHDELIPGLVASPPRSVVSNMSFMQSTPSTTDNRLVSGFELFGGSNPLSPIVPLSRPVEDHALQYTPVISQSRRTRRVIEINDDGKSRIKSPAHVDKLPDIEKIGPDSSMDETIETMTVKQFFEDLIKKNIQSIKGHGEKVKQNILSYSDSIRHTLIASVDNNNQEG